MYTQCPECGTIFKVTPDVLRVARGVVRCGVCDATFNAVHFLSSQPVPSPASGPRQRLAPPAATPTPTPAGLASLHAQVAAFQAAQPDTFSTGRFAARIASSLREAEHERAWIPPHEDEDSHPGGTVEAPVAAEVAPEPSRAAAEPPAAASAPPASSAAQRRDAEIEAAPDAALEFDPVATDWNTVFITPASRSLDARPDAPFEPAAPAAVDREIEVFVEDTHPSIGDGRSDRRAAERAAAPEHAAGAYDAHQDLDEEDEDDEAEDSEDDLDFDDDVPMPLSARPDAQAIDRLFRETAAAADVQHKSAAGAHRVRHTDAPGDLVASHDEEFAHELEPLPESAYAPASPPGSTFEAVWEPLEGHPQPAEETAAGIGEPIVVARPTRTVEPLTLTMPEPVQPSRGYAAAVVLALLVLGVQAVHYWRESIAAMPVAGPAIQRAYEAIGRPIEPRWRLTEFEVKQLGASSDVPGTLRLLARVQNKATRAQPYPLLRVTLLDRFETKIARREFTPAEYLPSRRRPEGLLPPEQRVDADLLLADPGNDAVNYELDVCLYEHNRLVCGQDAQANP